MSLSVVGTKDFKTGTGCTQRLLILGEKVTHIDAVNGLAVAFWARRQAQAICRDGYKFWRARDTRNDF